MQQLVHPENEDAGADLCNPCYTPLAMWDDQVKAAIVAACQESVALSKDRRLCSARSCLASLLVTIATKAE